METIGTGMDVNIGKEWKVEDETEPEVCVETEVEVYGGIVIV